MAAAPTGIRIRSYNVGFGDCFLLTFSYASGRPRNVLIDFGSTKQSASGPRGGMPTIAEAIREDCGGKLDMLVATHRHADHISGFGGEAGDVIASLAPELVVQPWTEEPGLDPEAKAPDGETDGALQARAAVARLSAMQAMAETALDQVPKLKRSRGVSKTVTDQIAFLGETNLANLDAVKKLAEMGERKKDVYAHCGTKLALGKILPGVHVEVLGPPTLEQSAAISHQAATDEEEFWHLAVRDLAVAEGTPPGDLFPEAPTTRPRSQEARWLMPRVDRMRGEEMLAIVRSLDGVLNNTSVILLFEVGDRRLVFPGDAQLENWHYALRECEEAEKIRERLADACFYKVGHHGSLNATPKSLWNGFDRRGPKSDTARLATMVSTMAGKHGSTARGTEVPRSVLIKELTKSSELKNTQSLKTRELFWNDVELEV